MRSSADSRSLQSSDRRSAVRTSMLLVGVLVMGISLLLSTSLMFQANTQVETGPPIVKASDKWIRLGVDASTGHMPTALSRYEAINPIEPKQTRPRHKGRGMQVTSRGPHGIHAQAQSSSGPVRWSVASACPNIAMRGTIDGHNSACPSNRDQAATSVSRRSKDGGRVPQLLRNA